MNILQVIHGYPMRYNAGSEVYTQTLSRGLAEQHEVHVFTREEDPYSPDYQLRKEHDTGDDRVTLHLVNQPRTRDRYQHEGVDQRFAQVLEEVRPDIVHVGHLNHLSTSLLTETAERAVPIVFTLHDFWIMCPRGQFMQMQPGKDELWPVCKGQNDRRCAEHCYSRYFSGDPADREGDLAHWADWVHRRMTSVRSMANLVACFIAPSRYLHDRFRDAFGLPESKLTYLDYGFDLSRLSGRERIRGEPFTFGYIGTHIPSKGIDLLLRAFSEVKGPAQLRLWGRERETTPYLKGLAQGFPNGASHRVYWMGEYRNEDIMGDVFNRVDAIVVPSIWVENSPLVIHEAQQARVPVVTADVGGMAELVRHDVNGLCFRHRDAASLTMEMQRLVDAPDWAAELGSRGYLRSETGDVPALAHHLREVESIYADVLERRGRLRVKPKHGPWRITLDTNPDDCNLHCIMCEQHSLHSTAQTERRAAKLPKRHMPLELVRSVITQAAAMGVREVIPSTMGEPLLYEHFDEIIDLCTKHGLTMNLTTNGTFPRGGARIWAQRIVPITSDVKISINGATANTQERIMVGTRLDRVLENVREFIAVRDAHATEGGNRCRVTFQLTFLDSNLTELPDLVRLAAQLGVDRVKGHHLWAHFPEIREESMRRNAEAIARWNHTVAEARAISEHHKLPDGRAVLLENIYPLDPGAEQDLAPDGQCPFLGQEAWISAEGRFDPCCAPDAQRRTLGELGNLHRDALADIWQGNDYRRLLASYSNRALCLSCNMRKPAEVQ